MSDLVGAGLTVGFVLVFLITSEYLAHTGKISKEDARKLIHISVGNVIFFIPFFESKWTAAIIPFTFIFGNYLLSPHSPLKKMKLKTFEAGHSWGTIYYPISLTIVVFFGFDTPWLIVGAFLPLVYGDGFAAVFGPRASQGKFHLYSGDKTLLGSSAFSFFTWLSVLLGTVLMGESVEFAIILASIVMIGGLIIELLSPSGKDNLTIPLILLPMLMWLGPSIMDATNNIHLSLYLTGVSVGFILAAGGKLSGVLSTDAAFTGFLITTLMLGLGGYTLGAELIFFFLVGSVATKMVRKFAGQTQDEFEKGGAKRDAIQAIAKAGIPAIMGLVLVFQPIGFWFFLATGILAAAVTDTMATEIGIASKGDPRLPHAPWKKTSVGKTGAISGFGTLGGIGFGLLFAILMYAITQVDPYIPVALDVNFIWIVIVSGFVGMYFDALTGYFIQRKYWCPDCEIQLETSVHHGKTLSINGGVRWFGNDLTNFVGTLFGGLCSAIIYLLN